MSITSLLPYLSYLSNYNFINYNNLHNFNYKIMTDLDDSYRKTFIDNMKLTIGLTYTTEFKLYIFKKIPNSDLLKYF